MHSITIPLRPIDGHTDMQTNTYTYIHTDVELYYIDMKIHRWFVLPLQTPPIEILSHSPSITKKNLQAKPIIDTECVSLNCSN